MSSPEQPKVGDYFDVFIENVDNAKNVLVLKRGLNPGFAGIENEIFFDSKTMMLFGDAKKSIMNLIEKIQDL